MSSSIVAMRACRRCVDFMVSCRHSAITSRVSQTALCNRRSIHHTPRLSKAVPKSKDRGPASKEDTQTDFGAMDMLGNMPAPTTSVIACMSDGFAFDNGFKITGAGAILMSGEAFIWRPWYSKGTIDGVKFDRARSKAAITNAKGQFDVEEQALGLLEVVWPKPELLVVGTGKSIIPLSVSARRRLSDLGIRVEVQDTRNAAAQFNLLATERGTQQIAAALIPIGV